jgi:N-acetylglucosaminyl-diphospho-decaprenol L-rhamnosyltransferase
MTARLIVSYNSAEALQRFATPLSIPTLVVDNASTDLTRKVAEGLGFRVLALDANHGFGSAIMKGLAALDDELVLVVNPDLSTDEAALEALIDAAQRYPEADLFVPAILKPDGTSFFRFESRFEPRAVHREPPEGEACIATMSGAAFLVRRSSFLTHGFDPAIFLYFEDDDLSLSYAAARRPIIYLPQTRVIHAGNVSSVPNRATDRLKNISFGWSWGYVMMKHRCGDPAASARGLILKMLGALLTFRFSRLRRHAETREGLLAFLAGRKAPYSPP